MPKYLIEVSQPANVAAKQIATSVRTIGSHFATHACWHQRNGMATGSLIVDADDRRRALCVVPPNMRPGAKVMQLEASAANAGPATAIFDRAPMPFPLAA